MTKAKMKEVNLELDQKKNKNKSYSIEVKENQVNISRIFMIVLKAVSYPNEFMCAQREVERQSKNNPTCTSALKWEMLSVRRKKSHSFCKYLYANCYKSFV